MKKYLGKAFFKVLSQAWRSFDFLRRKSEGKLASPENILVIEFLRIGDTVVCLPAISQLKKRYPESRLTLLVIPHVSELIGNLDYVDEVLTFEPRNSLPGFFCMIRFARELRTKKFNLCLVLDTSFAANLVAFLAGIPERIGYDSHDRGFLLTRSFPAPSYWNVPIERYNKEEEVAHQVDSWLRLLSLIGIEPEKESPVLKEHEDEANFLKSFFGGEIPKYAVIHPGSPRARRWRPERFAQIADWLAEDFGLKIVISGAGFERELAAEVKSLMKKDALIGAGRMNLPRFAALLRKSRIVVSVDTSAGHIADAVGTRAVVLFGPGDERIWRPYGKKHRLVSAVKVVCRGCKKVECVREKHYCMDAIGIDEVKEAVKSILSEGGS